MVWNPCFRLALHRNPKWANNRKEGGCCCSQCFLHLISLFFFPPPAKCLVIVHLKWEFGGGTAELHSSKQRCSLCSVHKIVLFFQLILFLASLLQCLENYILLWRIGMSLMVPCPLITVLEGLTSGCIPTFTLDSWIASCRVSSQHARRSWDESSFNLLPTNSTYAKQYLGCN